ncbi:MAG: hypothetical protein ACK40I_03515 [Tabrizicola sp.]
MILTAPAGIVGLTLGRTLRELGPPFRIHECVAYLRPKGHGINIQPNVVRELFDPGLKTELAKIGIRTRKYGVYTGTGLPICVEPRGSAAGFSSPPFSLHRSPFQMLLLRALQKRGRRRRDGRRHRRVRSRRSGRNPDPDLRSPRVW